jgi:hypothetical protein
MAEQEARYFPSEHLPAIQKLHTIIAAIRPNTAMTLHQMRRHVYLCQRLAHEMNVYVRSWESEVREDTQVDEPKLYQDVDTELGLPEAFIWPHPTAEKDTTKWVLEVLQGHLERHNEPSDGAGTEDRIEQEGELKDPKAGRSQ